MNSKKKFSNWVEWLGAMKMMKQFINLKLTIMSIMYKSENNSDGPESFMNFEFFAVFMNAQVDTYVADTNDAKL